MKSTSEESDKNRLKLDGLEIEFRDGEVRLCSHRDPLHPIWMSIASVRTIAAAAERSR